MSRPPRIFHVNWFRTGDDGRFLWPGYGENLRVIEWILARSRNEGAAVSTPIGYVPTSSALDLTGLDVPQKKIDELFYVDTCQWSKQAEEIFGFFRKFGDRFPKHFGAN